MDLTLFAGKRSQHALHLAQAALAIATANHYLVGYSADAVNSSLDDWQDARQILIEAEIAQGPKPRTRSKLTTFDRAFRVLTLECMRQHRVDLSA